MTVSNFSLGFQSAAAFHVGSKIGVRMNQALPEDWEQTRNLMPSVMGSVCSKLAMASQPSLRQVCTLGFIRGSLAGGLAARVACVALGVLVYSIWDIGSAVFGSDAAENA